MKKILCFVFTFWASFAMTSAQSAEEQLTKSELSDHIRYLASDELAGRQPGTPGIEAAARYIAYHFEAYGLKQVSGADGWFQSIPFVRVKPAKTGSVTLNGQTFEQGKTLLVRDGGAFDQTAQVVLAGYGWIDAQKGTDDYNGLEVKGKVVVVRFGRPDSNSPGAGFNAGAKKREWAKERGAIALVEVYDSSLPWANVLSFVGRPNTGIDNGVRLPHFWVKPDDPKTFLGQVSGEAKLQSSGMTVTSTPSSNVLGWIEGTDPVLKKEFILLSAHYDHVGIGKPTAAAPADSIYNGARDNAMGTVALIAAAKAFMAERPKRSILIAAWTAEEMGLLGSRYFAEHPLVPLANIAFNLNIDNAGWNDTKLITVIGLDRTTAQPHIEKGAADFGLKAINDPSPEQGLFDRSDNVNMAAAGIPAPTYSGGFTAFDQTIFQFYHQPSDHADDKFDFDYFQKYVQGFIRVGRYIANDPNKPFWKSGDKYEAAGKKLYGMN